MPANPASILDSVKKAIGMDPEFTAFDLDVVLFTNAAFGVLRQLGVGSNSGFIISDNVTLWEQYVADLRLLGMVKQYIFMSVRLALDPPATSFGIDAIKNQMEMLGWRINVAAEEANPPSDPFASSSSSGGSTTSTIFVPTVVNLEYAVTVTPDASAGQVFYLELTGNCTINAPVNGADGEHITLELTSNGHTVTWGNGWNFGAAGTPSLSASSTDIVSSVYRGSATDWYSGFTSGF
jgi:hypothetical protein